MENKNKLILILLIVLVVLVIIALFKTNTNNNKINDIEKEITNDENSLNLMIEPDNEPNMKIVNELEDIKNNIQTK